MSKETSNCCSLSVFNLAIAKLARLNIPAKVCSAGTLNIEGEPASVHAVEAMQDIGVDIVGDIFDDQFLINLKKSDFKCVFCCNFLEHVFEPQDLINRCMSILPIGGILVLTVPYSYPFHRDPIDTLYRPNIEQLASLVSNHEIISNEILIMKLFDFTLC